MTTKEIIYFTVDGGSEYLAIYDPTGKIHSYNDSYNFGIEEGFKLARQYPDAVLVRADADEEWLDEVFYEVPDNLSDAKFTRRTK